MTEVRLIYPISDFLSENCHINSSWVPWSAIWLPAITKA